MTMIAKPVVWRDGMFLRAQHFQQQQRANAALVKGQPTSLRGYDYGFYQLRLNTEWLSQGKVAVLSAQGVFSDGRIFSFPELDAIQNHLDVDEQVKDQLVYLCLSEKAITSVAPKVNAIQDAYSTEEKLAEIEVISHNGEILLEQDDRRGYSCLPIAKIKHVRADKKVVLDDTFLAPLLNVKSETMLTQFMLEVEGLLQHRAEVLSARLTHTQQSESAIIADFLLLQLTNRYHACFSGLNSRSYVHPEMLCNTLVELVAELATFTQDTRRVHEHIHYQHDQLGPCLYALMKAVRHNLSQVLEQHAVAISLLSQNYGVYLADIHDVGLLEEAQFVLAVHADKPLAELKQHIPSLLKIAPVDSIRDLVSRGLMGVNVQALEMAPRQIPYHSQFVYFSINTQADLWQKIIDTKALALHLAGEFNDLRMELWAIRS